MTICIRQGGHSGPRFPLARVNLRGGGGGYLIENVIQQVFAARLGLFSGVDKERYDCIPHTPQLQAVTLYTVYLEEESGCGVIELLSTPCQYHLHHPNLGLLFEFRTLSLHL